MEEVDPAWFSKIPGIQVLPLRMEESKVKE
jgi:hypothetical protein